MGLENKLLEILDEKVKVLSDLEKIIYSGIYELSEEHERILTLQSINMMYSVWEGFISASLKEYINHINEELSNFSDLSDNIIAYNMVTEVKQFVNPPEEVKKNKFNIQGYAKFYNDFKNYVSSSTLKVSNRFNTESNVGFEVLNRLLDTFNIEKFEDDWGDYKRSNNRPSLAVYLKQFLDDRNAIAHGAEISSSLIIKKEKFEEYRKLIMELMYEITTRILDSASNESYKR